MPMFAVIIMIVKIQKLSKYPSMDKCIKILKRCYIYTIEYYPVTKIKKKKK